MKLMAEEKARVKSTVVCHCSSLNSSSCKCHFLVGGWLSKKFQFLQQVGSCKIFEPSCSSRHHRRCLDMNDSHYMPHPHTAKKSMLHEVEIRDFKVKTSSLQRMIYLWMNSFTDAVVSWDTVSRNSMYTEILSNVCICMHLRCAGCENNAPPGQHT